MSRGETKTTYNNMGVIYVQKQPIRGKLKGKKT